MSGVMQQGGVDHLLQRVLHEGQLAFEDIAGEQAMHDVLQYIHFEWLATLRDQCMKDARAAQNLILFLTYASKNMGLGVSAQNLMMQQFLHEYPTHSGVVYQVLHFYGQSQWVPPPPAWRILHAVAKLVDPELEVVNMACQCLARSTWDDFLETMTVACSAVKLVTVSVSKYSSASIAEDPSFISTAMIVLDTVTTKYPRGLTPDHVIAVVAMIHWCFEEDVPMDDSTMLVALEVLLRLSPRDPTSVAACLGSLLSIAACPQSKQWHPECLACLLRVVYASTTITDQCSEVNLVLDALTVQVESVLILPVSPRHMYEALDESIDCGMALGSMDMVSSALAALRACVSSNVCTWKGDPLFVLWRLLGSGYCQDLWIASCVVDVLKYVAEFAAFRDVVMFVEALVTSVLESMKKEVEEPTLNQVLTRCVGTVNDVLGVVPKRHFSFYSEECVNVVHVLSFNVHARGNEELMDSLLVLGLTIQTITIENTKPCGVDGSLVRRRLFSALKPVIQEYPRLVSGLKLLRAYEGAGSLRDPRCRCLEFIPRILEIMMTNPDAEFWQAAIEFLVECIGAGATDTPTREIVDFVRAQVVPAFIPASSKTPTFRVLQDFGTYVNLLHLLCATAKLDVSVLQEVDVKTVVCTLAELPEADDVPRGTDAKLIDALLSLSDHRLWPQVSTYTLLSTVQVSTPLTFWSAQVHMLEECLAYAVSKSEFSSTMTDDEIISLLSYYPLSTRSHFLSRKLEMVCLAVGRTFDDLMGCLRAAVDNLDRFARRSPWLWFAVVCSSHRGKRVSSV